MADNKNKKEAQLELDLAELTADLQRVQADFVNYRDRVEDERKRTIEGAKAATIMKLLPVVDDANRAISHVPRDLADNSWVKGVTALDKRLEKSLADMGVTHIPAVGEPFDPELHEAVSADGEGEHEIVSQELRAGYMLGGQVIRPSMVEITSQDKIESEQPEKVQEVIEQTKIEEEQVDIP